MESISKQPERKINQASDKMKDTIDAARRRTVDVIDDALVGGDEALATARHRGEAYWENALETGAGLWDDVTKKTRQGWKEVSYYIQKRPLQTVGMAVVAGVIIGVLSVVRRDR